MTLIYINDVLCDLKPNTVIAISLKTLSVGNLSARYSNRTNNIKLPKTETNIALFGYINEISSASRTVYTSNVARVIVNGIEVINSGTAVVNSIDDDINISIYSGSYGFINDIGDKELKDLTDANADSAVMGNMVMSTGVSSDYYFSMPISKFSTIIEAIISEAGYTKAGSIFSSNDYLRMILIYGRDGNELNENFALEKQFKAINTGDSVSALGGYTKFDYDTEVINGALSMYSSGTWSTDNATDYAFQFTLQADINISVSGGTGSVRISFLRDGSEVGTPVDIATGGAANQTISYTGTHAAATDYSYVVGYKHVSGSGATITVTEITYQVIVSREWYNIATVGSSDIQNKYMLPDIKQIDLLSEFMRFYGLVPVETNKTITFKTIESILNDRAGAVDWTSKRVNTSDAISFRSDYGRSNNFKYTKFDENDITMGDHTEPISNVNLPTEKDLITSIFSDSKTTIKEHTIGNWINMIDIPVYTGSDVEDAGLRIAMYRAKYSFEVSALSSVAYFNEPREDYSMTWSYFVNNYYSTLFSILQDIKVVTYSYVLTEADIVNFDQTKLIYDNGNYYAFPEITNYIPGKITKVTMLKI